MGKGLELHAVSSRPHTSSSTLMICCARALSCASCSSSLCTTIDYEQRQSQRGWIMFST